MSVLIRRATSVAAALTVGLTLACAPAPSEAAPAPVLDYDTGENPRDIGDWPKGPIVIDATWTAKQWPVDKVVAQVRKQTGLDVRVCRVKRDLPNYSPCGQVTVSSDSSTHTGPTGKRLGEVSLWSTNRVLDFADISLDDPDGKKAGATKREARLRSYLVQAVGR